MYIWLTISKDEISNENIMPFYSLRDSDTVSAKITGIGSAGNFLITLGRCARIYGKGHRDKFQFFRRRSAPALF